MTLEHHCRIVRDAGTAEGRWALYWDGAYCDDYPSTQQARAAGLSLCHAGRSQVQIVIHVEDASGRRMSTERLFRPAIAA